LSELLSGDRSADRQFAVVFVDLDNFKEVNDSHGHLLGDRVLCEAAWRLCNCVREGDHVVRFGGDEFILLLEHVSAPTDIDLITSRIRMVLAEPIALPDDKVTLSVSIGVAKATPDHRTPDDLLNEADRAMYASKRLNA
jgi:diguanylate cyclase (GGDEF)-like protein